MENWIFKIFDKIESVNKKISYFGMPYGTKIINHIKENTIGSIMLIIFVAIIFYNINKIFQKKYGHSIVVGTYLFLSPVGALLYGGKYWLEYAMRNNKIKWYPMGFILFFLSSTIFLVICIIIKIIKEKNLSGIFGLLLSTLCFLIFYEIAKDLLFLFLFFIILNALSGIFERKENTYIIEQRNDIVGPNF